MSVDSSIKICSVCEEEKPLTEFYKYWNKNSKKYRQSEKGRIIYKRASDKYNQSEHGRIKLKKFQESDAYKAYHKIYSKKYNQSEKGKIVRKRAQKKYRQSDHGKFVMKLYSDKYYSLEHGLAIRKKNNQSENHKISVKKYRQTDKGKLSFKKGIEKYRQSTHGKKAIKEYSQLYSSKIRRREYGRSEQGKATKRKYLREKRRDNINYRIRCNLSSRLNQALKNNYKGESTKKLLGCTIQELRFYLEDQFQLGMSWKNYGRNGWELDHIKPCVSFDLSKTSEQRECFHYLNLQPLWAKDNARKGSRHEEEILCQ